MSSPTDSTKLTPTSHPPERRRRTARTSSSSSSSSTGPIHANKISVVRLFVVMALRIGLVCLPAILLVAFLVASFLSVINIDDDLISKTYRGRMYSYLEADDAAAAALRHASSEHEHEVVPVEPLAGQTKDLITDSPAHLMWFLHISDLHISKFYDPKRQSDFERFCSDVVDIFQPSVVVATGDLTDGRTRNPMGSEQQEEEWIAYRRILNESRLLDKVTFLDIRGNHDNFNVLNWNSDNNFYRRYSPTGGKHSSSYVTVIRPRHDPTSRYTFIGLDACLRPGPRRPFNFVGYLNATHLDRVRELGERAERETEYTIWFGHYPTSSIASPGPGIRSLIRGPYLSGHFHRFVPNMYASHTGASLDAEIDDWKDRRRFRLAAVDHSLFSFSDTSLDRWPVIVITNPKKARDALPDVEPLNLIRTSTHVRALVFSAYVLRSVQAAIDDQPWAEMRKDPETPLWTLRWDPQQYSKGLHHIRVRATDSEGNTHTEENDFSLDGSRNDFTFGAKFVLRWHMRSFSMTLFIGSVLLAVVPLVTMRVAYALNYHRFLRVKSEYSFSSRMLLKYFLLAANDSTFWPLVAIPLYATCGPWFVGEVAEGHHGVFFVWGILIDSTYLPGGFTYVFGALQIFLFHVPLTLLSANLLHHRYCTLEASLNPSLARNSSLKSPPGCVQRTFLALLQFLWWFVYAVSLLFTLNFYFAYGWLAYATGVFVSWPALVYLWIWYRTTSAAPETFPPAFRARLKCNSGDLPAHSIPLDNSSQD